MLRSQVVLDFDVDDESPAVVTFASAAAGRQVPEAVLHEGCVEWVGVDRQVLFVRHEVDEVARPLRDHGGVEGGDIGERGGVELG